MEAHLGPKFRKGLLSPKLQVGDGLKVGQACFRAGWLKRGVDEVGKHFNAKMASCCWRDKGWIVEVGASMAGRKVGKHVAMYARAVDLSMWECSGPIGDGGKEGVGFVRPYELQVHCKIVGGSGGVPFWERGSRTF